MLLSSTVPTALLGRDTVRTATAFGVGLALFLAVRLAGGIAQSRGWTEHWFARYPLLVIVLVLVAGGGLAAANAYWNDGLIPSWFLVFAPVFGWLWNVFVYEGPPFFAGTIEAGAWAALPALVVGTGGYVVGSSRRGRPAREAAGASSNWLLRLLVGDEPGRWILLASGLFVGTSGLFYVAGPNRRLPIDGAVLLDLFVPLAAFTANTLLGVVVLLAWLGVATWPAYRGAGLLVDWGVLFGPLFGAMLFDYLGDVGGATPLLEATFALVASLVLALGFGTAGFLLGLGLRRIRPARNGNVRGSADGC